MPIDDVRRALVDFGPGYYELESTYLVTGASGIVDVTEVDRPHLRVVAIAGTTTIRASSRTLKTVQPRPAASVAEAIAQMRSGEADAFAPLARFAAAFPERATRLADCYGQLPADLGSGCGAAGAAGGSGGQSPLGCKKQRSRDWSAVSSTSMA